MALIFFLFVSSFPRTSFFDVNVKSDVLPPANPSFVVLGAACQPPRPPTDLGMSTGLTPAPPDDPHISDRLASLPID